MGKGYSRSTICVWYPYPTRHTFFLFFSYGGGVVVWCEWAEWARFYINKISTESMNNTVFQKIMPKSYQFSHISKHKENNKNRYNLVIATVFVWWSIRGSNP